MQIANITSVKIGTTPVTKIYQGSNLIWPKTVNVTPTAPILVQDDVANTISASHPNYPTTEIEVMGADTYYVSYTGTISVGNVDQSAGYWKFRIKAAPGRNIGAVASSAPFTSVISQNITPNPPTIFADDTANTIDASSSQYPDTEILISINNGAYTQFDGNPISVGNISVPAGYYKFKIKAATGRDESAVASSPSFTVSTISSGTTYTLNQAGRVSTMVFKSDGTNIRNLESGIQKNAGTYPIVWDGTDDFGQNAPVDNYTIKVTSNNITYEWQGTIGNNSSTLTEPGVHHSLEVPSGFLITNNKAYIALAYNEGPPSMTAFNLSSPRTKLTDIFKDISIIRVNYVATDGVNLYWTAENTYKITESWIFATKISDNSQVTFSSGVSTQVERGAVMPSVINKKTNGFLPTGIAVSSSHIFVSYKDQNTIDVLNKSTGAFVRSLSFTAPTCMTIDGNKLWINSNTNNLQQYAINSDGTLIAITFNKINSVVSPIGLRVNGTTLAVIDGGTSQQVKFFSTVDGTMIGQPFGQAGGLKTSAIVSNDRFGFWKIKEETGEFIPFGSIDFAPDGSFWLFDPSNRRFMHYDTNRNFIEQVMYQAKIYSTTIDPNNNRRIIANMLEFEDDPSKPIDQSWILKYNWEANYSFTYKLQNSIKHMVTLSNNRTYAILTRQNNYREIVELIPSFGIRPTGVLLTDIEEMDIKSDGTIINFTGRGLNGTGTWQSKKISGFDSSNNPIVPATWTTITTNNLTSMVEPRLSGAMMKVYETTTQGNIVCYRGNREQPLETRGSYHLGLYDPIAKKWIWKTSQSNFREYEGMFPTGGDFEIGNTTNGEGSVAICVGRHIFSFYFGEGWRVGKGGGQASKINHHYDNGLFLGQFGKTAVEYNLDPVGGAAFAGNIFSPSIVQYQGDIYAYINDEGVHGGVMRWKISGLNTISEQTINLPSNYTKVPEGDTEGVSLQSTIPFNTIVTGNSVGGFNITPAPSGGWAVRTNALSYSPRKTNDLYMTNKNSNAGTYTVTTSLGNNSGLTAWKLWGKLSWNLSMPNFPDGNGLNEYFDILDNTGKIIVRFYQDITFLPNNVTSARVLANSSVIKTGTRNEIQVTSVYLQPLTIFKNGSSISVSYANFNPVSFNTPYETGANMSNPTTLRILFVHNGQGGTYEKFLGINEFRFNSNPTISLP